jgi:SWI/SNF-related matrix-associated actin-dependent regulator of chromatin subfamily A protein 2/4
MDNLLNNNFKKEKSAKYFLENNNIYKKRKHNQLIECMTKNDPLFDLINQHKKRLQEIKEWQMSITGDVLQSEITMIDAADKNNKSKKDLNNNNVEQPVTKIEESKIDNNIKLAKDFLKLNSINKNQSSIAIDNTCTINNNNNDDSSININISNTNNNNNIINENNNNITNNINQNENDNNLENNNTNDNSFSALKDSLRNDLDVNANDNNNGFVKIVERKYMKTGINFNKKLALDNIKNIDINNYKSNNNTNNKKHRHYSSRLTSYNVTNCTNNDIVNSLEFKLEKKRIKIKNLETTIDLLTKENNNLKIYINELETKIENFHLINNNKKKLFTQEMLDKINSLNKEIKDKNEIIEKMKISEKLKNQELQVLEVLGS